MSILSSATFLPPVDSGIRAAHAQEAVDHVLGRLWQSGLSVVRQLYGASKYRQCASLCGELLLKPSVSVLHG